MKGFVHLGIVVIVGLALLVTGATIYEQKYMQPEVSLGAPVSNIFNNILPSANQTYDIGSTTPAAEWKNIYAKNITISGTCTGCGSGSTFPFTPTDYGNSTTSIIKFGGLITTASSTLNIFAINNLTSAGFVKTAANTGALSVDTTTYLSGVTADSPLSGAGTSASHLVLDTSGTWSGNAGTATALAADPTDCATGFFALGINA